MPKILITGNGFDLSIGLPTSYTDFVHILTLVEKNRVLDFETVYSNTLNQKKIFESFNEFQFNDNSVAELKTLIGKNLWFQFFKNECEIETWIDFENKIEYVLKNLFSSVDYIISEIFSNGSFKAENLQYNTGIFNNDFEIIEVLKKFKIIDFDNNTITLNTHFITSKYGYFTNIDIDKITKHLNTELVQFKKIFNCYLEIFVLPLYDHSKNKFENIFKNVSEHITFNYTPTFDKIYKRATTTKFLHGKVCSLQNKIVLGINEVPTNEKVDKKHFLPFTKYFQKLDYNTDYAFIKECEKNKNSNFVFFFWGHSLDKSDEDYINEVFNFVATTSSKRRKIVIAYHTENSKSNLILNLLEIRGKTNVVDLMKNKTLQFFHIESKELTLELNSDIDTSSFGTSVF